MLSFPVDLSGEGRGQRAEVKNLTPSATRVEAPK
jgi:hypothetical protein